MRAATSSMPPSPRHARLSPPGARFRSRIAGRALHAFAAHLREHVDAIAPILTHEQGKPLATARGELLRGAEHIEGLLPRSSSVEDLLRDDARGRIELRYRPLGVVGAIAPWNAPIVLAMHKIAQALYTGNCIVLKPSPLHAARDARGRRAGGRPLPARRLQRGRRRQ